MRFLCVSGSRDIKPGSRQWNRVVALVEAQSSDTIVVHGKCPTGADEAAAQTAHREERPELAFPARWKLFKRPAGMKRNRVMAKFLAAMEALGATVEVHCFFEQGAKNVGTTGMHDVAVALGLTVVRHE